MVGICSQDRFVDLSGDVQLPGTLLRNRERKRTGGLGSASLGKSPEKAPSRTSRNALRPCLSSQTRCRRRIEQPRIRRPSVPRCRFFVFFFGGPNAFPLPMLLTHYGKSSLAMGHRPRNTRICSGRARARAPPFGLGLPSLLRQATGSPIDPRSPAFWVREGST
jgi:hypothetical protein